MKLISTTCTHQTSLACEIHHIDIMSTHLSSQVIHLWREISYIQAEEHKKYLKKNILQEINTNP